MKTRKAVDILERYGRFEWESGRGVDGKFPKLSKEEAQKALLEDLLEIVGKDDKQDWDDEMEFCQKCHYEPFDSQECICVFNNRVRAELRTALKAYFGDKE